MIIKYMRDYQYRWYTNH